MTEAEKLAIFDNSPEGLCVIDGNRYYLRDGQWTPWWNVLTGLREMGQVWQ